MAWAMWCTWDKWLTLSHVLHDVIKGKKEIKKIRKKNMVLTSVMEESGGKFPPLFDHPVDANLNERRKEKMMENRGEKGKKRENERNKRKR